MMKTGPGFFSPKNLVFGAGLAMLLSALSAAFAFWGFGRLYYMSVFLGLSVFACLALAWFAYLRSDGFGKNPEETTPPDTEAPSGGLLPLYMYAKKDRGIIARGPVLETRNKQAKSVSVKIVLLWAAIWLTLASAVFYKIYGIGSVYFL